VGQKRFSLEGGESIIPALDTLIERAAEMGVEQFVMGITSWPFEYFGKYIWQIYTRYFRDSKVRITIKNILMVMLSII
jgi:hypothetical protein